MSFSSMPSSWPATSSSWNRSFFTEAILISLSFLFSRHSSRTFLAAARSAEIFFTWAFTSSRACSSFFMRFSRSAFSSSRTLPRALISLILSALSTISCSRRFFSSAADWICCWRFCQRAWLSCRAFRRELIFSRIRFRALSYWSFSFSFSLACCSNFSLSRAARSLSRSRLSFCLSSSAFFPSSSARRPFSCSISRPGLRSRPR